MTPPKAARSPSVRQELSLKLLNPWASASLPKGSTSVTRKSAELRGKSKMARLPCRYTDELTPSNTILGPDSACQAPDMGCKPYLYSVLSILVNTGPSLMLAPAAVLVVPLIRSLSSGALMQPVWARALAWRCALRIPDADERTPCPPWVPDVLQSAGDCKSAAEITRKRCPAQMRQNWLLDTGTASCCHMSAVSRCGPVITIWR